MKKFIFFILSPLLLLLARPANASHIVGADISYQCIGANTYEFTLMVYRDCDGIPVQPTYKLDYSSLSCNIQGNITLTQFSIQEISPVCAADSSTCLGGLQPGIQQYVYKGTLVMPASCSDWVFSWTDCTRNHEIVNILDPHNTCLYIEATLNNLVAPCNNSPSFSNPPVSFICKGQGNFINPGTIEDDGDQLSFSVVTPKSGKVTTVSYVSPFSALNPLSSSPGFSINSTSGDISIYPVNDTEVSVTAIVAEERRNGVLIGSVMRDIQLITRNCNNNNPVLSGINNTSLDEISVCAGKEVCFNVFGSDPDAGQKLTMTWNQPFDSATSKFTVTGTTAKPKANICWKPNASEVGLHFFTITLTDDFCPIVGSTTRSYKIRVNPNPIVKLPNDTTIACNQTVTLTPVVTLGTAPFVYKWNSGEISTSVTKGQGFFSVKVTDANGCVGQEGINISTGVNADFNFVNLCIGQTTNFTDASNSLAGTIVSWDWNFGDPASGVNNTSTLQNPTHTFSTNKTFLVKLTVTDNFGCQGTVTKQVKFCDIPQPDFIHLDSCQNKLMTYRDLTTVKNCGIKHYTMQISNANGTRTIWDFDFSSPFFPPGFNFYDNPPDTGIFTVTLTAINENDCPNTISHTVHINPQPKTDILEDDYYFDCSKPDTILHGIVVEAKPPYITLWDNGSTALTRPINQPGAYSFKVIDANGCEHVSTMFVKDPLYPALSHAPVCEPIFPIQFGDSSFSHWGKVHWEYKFDDGTSFSTSDVNLSHPAHLYPVGDAVYYPTLIITDSKGCIDSVSKRINYEFPDNHFEVNPTPQCLGQIMYLESPKGSYIDSLVWAFGNGDTMKVGRDYFGKPGSEPRLVQEITGGDTLYYYNGQYIYPSGAGSTFTVDLKMYYNDTACVRTYSKNISLFDELSAEIDSILGYCGYDTTFFYASQKNSSGGTNEVNSWDWKFYYQQQTPPYTLTQVNSSTVQNPKIIFTQNGNHFADLTVKNADGCELVVDRESFTVVNLPQPYFCTLNNCATQKTQFFYFCNSFPEVVIDSIYWDFGDGGFSNVREPFHIYATAGTYNVTVKIFNTAFDCMKDTTIAIIVHPLPDADFTYDTVCLGQLMHFTDLSTPAVGDAISSWQWSFGDGQFSIAQNPSHLYADIGTYNVRLVITSAASGCTDTIIKPVIVRPNPIAGFTMTVNELVTGKPIQFIDQSSGGVKWLWHFGDGDSLVITDPLHTSPSHTYNASAKYVTIEQIVYNQFGCTDTARVGANLIIYFILPNSFTPNGDGRNDGFYPTYKGIEKITEFKVYDRWGQLVYEGDGNLEAHWDGKYKGTDQPVGVYVYFARAIAFNKEEFVLSGKVTLIR